MKPVKIEVILDFVGGRDVCRSVPIHADFGKTLATHPYILAAFDVGNSEVNSIAVVVTPLLAIVEDQLKKGSGRC